MLYRFLLTVFGYKYNKSFIHNSLRMKLFCWTAMRCGISHLIFSLCAIWVVVCSAFYPTEPLVCFLLNFVNFIRPE